MKLHVPRFGCLVQKALGCLAPKALCVPRFGCFVQKAHEIVCA